MNEKIINYCWFGKNEKTELIKKCIDSWKEKCPDYKIVEWNEENFNININKFVKEAYNQKKWAFVADYARLWIIYNYGGIYLDTDVELLKSFDESIYEYKGFFGIEEKLINTGLGFYAKKNDPLIKKLLDSYEDIEFTDKITCVIYNKKIFETELGSFDDEFKGYQNRNGYIVYSKEVFCPYNYKTRELNVTEDTIAIHWFGASWFSKSRKMKEEIKYWLRKIIGEKRIERLIKFIKNEK